MRSRGPGTPVRLQASSSREFYQAGTQIRFFGKIKVEPDSYLLIGSGRSEIGGYHGVDLGGDNWDTKVETLSKYLEVFPSFFRVGGRPAIPGSTIKGTLRSRLEHMFRKPRAPNGEVYSCFIKQERPRKNPTYLKMLDAPEGISERQADNPPKHPCFLCDLFGGLSLGSRVSCFDAKLLGPAEDWIKQVDIADENGDPVPTEVIRPGAEFAFSILMRNLGTREIGLLFLAMGFYPADTQNTVGIPIPMGQYKYDSQQIIDGKRFGKVRFELTGYKQCRYDKSQRGFKILEGKSGKIPKVMKKALDKLWADHSSDLHLLHEYSGKKGETSK